MKKFKAFTILLTICIFSTTAISILAARQQGLDPSNKAAYDCSFTTSSNKLNGYTNVSFIVSADEIKNGFTAYSEIKITSSDSLKSGGTKAYVSKGINYANTGTYTIDGYNKGTSSHNMVYSSKSISHTVSLSL